jgi:hypothetical protein
MPDQFAELDIHNCLKDFRPRGTGLLPPYRAGLVRTIFSKIILGKKDLGDVVGCEAIPPFMGPNLINFYRKSLDADIISRRKSPMERTSINPERWPR